MKDYICLTTRKIENISDLCYIPVKCKECNKPLDVGDYLDIFFPYYLDYCYCSDCYNEIK